MRRRAVALLVSLALVLPACSDDEPTPEPSASSSTPTASPSQTESESESAGKQPWEKRTKAGAKAFVEHYWETVNEAQRTGDTRELRSLGVDACKACSQGAAYIDRVYDAGGTIEGGTFTVAARTESLQDQKQAIIAIVSVEVETTSQLVSHAGKDNAQSSAHSAEGSFVLIWKGRGWRVSQWSTRRT